MPLPRGFSYLLAWLFAADRLDTWVLRLSLAIPVVCVAGLGLWHLAAYLARKRSRKRRPVRLSPEPPSTNQSPKLLPRARAPAEVAPSRNDPEGLQQACIALEDSLAGMYMELAESWLRGGKPEKAAAALKKILLICPEGHQALLAQDRLQQIGNEVEDPR